MLGLGAIRSRDFNFSNTFQTAAAHEGCDLVLLEEVRDPVGHLLDHPAATLLRRSQIERDLLRHDAMLLAVLHLVDQVLIMSVNPGFGGQKYLESQEVKIQKVCSWITDRGLEVDVEIDGGISSTTISQATSAGANVFVAGSAIFQHPDGPATAIAELRETALSAQ